MGSARVSPIIIRSISHQKYLPNAKEMKWLLKQFCLPSPIVEYLTGMISEGRGGKRRVLDFSSPYPPSYAAATAGVLTEIFFTDEGGNNRKEEDVIL